MPQPTMVNRQAVGTYKGKLISRNSGAYGNGQKDQPRPEVTAEEEKAVTVDRIECDDVQVVDIATLNLDPMNARLHPERNLDSIKQSLSEFGQRKPVVVRQENMVIVAGNGTVEAAKALGWTKIAASIRPMTDVEAMAYGLADNRTAELARWDFEVVAKLDEMIQKSHGPLVGWSQKELQALRLSQFVQPEQFPQVDESIEVEHQCPKCGYQWSGKAEN